MSDPIADVTKARRLLADVYTPKGVDIWMTSRNRNLGMGIPIDLIDSGRGEEVLAEVHRLVGGAW